MDIDLKEIGGDDMVKILMAENPGVIVQIADKDAEEFKTIMDNNSISTP